MPAFLLPMIMKGFGWIKDALKTALSLIKSYPLQCALVISTVALALLWRANNGLHDKIEAERAAHAATVASYKRAQAAAEAVQTHNLARVAKEQDAITERISDDFETRLAAARAVAAKLRASSNRSASANARLPAPGESPGQSPEAPGQDGFSLADRLTATEQALQLDALISWVEQQSGVETSPQ